MKEERGGTINSEDESIIGEILKIHKKFFTKHEHLKYSFSFKQGFKLSCNIITGTFFVCSNCLQLLSFVNLSLMLWI